MDGARSICGERRLTYRGLWILCRWFRRSWFLEDGCAFLAGHDGAFELAE